MKLHRWVVSFLVGIFSLGVISPGVSPAAQAIPMDHSMAMDHTLQPSSPYLGLSTATIRFGGALGFHYSPSLIFISPGDTVTWEGDFSMHPLVSDEGLWTTPTSGTTFSQTFNKPGAYHFHCFFHGAAGGIGMSGTVLVGFHAFLPVQVKAATP